jgi:8-oxo-dGTP pyrophosphatase MutT (NUDIX family)
MEVVFARQPFPTEVTATIMLCGPTQRSAEVTSWRKEALAHLSAAGFTGHVFVPENPDFSFNDWNKHFPYESQVGWEAEALNRADCILFWIPRDMETMPALTTNDEYGQWKSSGKVVLGTPPEADKVRYQRHYADKEKIPTYDSLQATCEAAVAKVMPGSLRRGGEAHIPQLVWNTPSFQSWYADLQGAGNRLDGGKVLWTFRVGPQKNFVFAWSLHADIHVAAEDRNKQNEFVLSRSDISSVLMYYIPPDATSVYDAEVVLVREFRSPVANSEGFVYELPGGSAHPNDDAKTLQNATKEVEEETGFTLDPSRVSPVGVRQVAATWSSHKAQLFTAKLTLEELHYFKGTSGQFFGDEGSTERCYPEVVLVRDLLDSDLCDWTTMGMILSAIVRG